MDHELLVCDMISGYRSYAQPADLDVQVTIDAPAATSPLPAISRKVCTLVITGATGVAVSEALQRIPQRPPL